MKHVLRGGLTYMSVRLTTLSLLRSAARRPCGECSCECTQKPDDFSAFLAAAVLTCQAPLPARQRAPRDASCRVQLQQRARVRAEQRFTRSHAVPPPGSASALLTVTARRLRSVPPTLSAASDVSFDNRRTVSETRSPLLVCFFTSERVPSSSCCRAPKLLCLPADPGRSLLG